MARKSTRAVLMEAHTKEYVYVGTTLCVLACLLRQSKDNSPILSSPIERWRANRLLANPPPQVRQEWGLPMPHTILSLLAWTMFKKSRRAWWVRSSHVIIDSSKKWPCTDDDGPVPAEKRMKLCFPVETAGVAFTSTRVPDWVLMLLKLRARISDDGWQTLINLTGLRRTKVKYMFEVRSWKNEVCSLDFAQNIGVCKSFQKIRGGGGKLTVHLGGGGRGQLTEYTWKIKSPTKDQ